MQKRISDRANSKCENPEAGMSLDSPRNGKRKAKWSQSLMEKEKGVMR